MTKSAFIAAVLGLSFLLPLESGADVLIIDEVRQVERMDVPDNGLSKAEVEARFGAPEERHGAVGDPPITRWDYGEWSVYFEYDLVLFTVLREGEVIEQS